MAPSWCSLPSDLILYDRPKPIERSPGLIRLESDSQCSCGAKYSPTIPTVQALCTIYCFNKAVSAKIELQRCPACGPRKRQFIGPDAREYGLFNFNNHTLFAHDLLDEYTSAFVASETPFVAWFCVINSRYQTYDLSAAFVCVDVFRAAWFAFVNLQSYDNDMTCTICGPNPEEVIWDGVTVAFNKKKLRSSLEPPTTTSTDSPIRNSIRYQPAQQLIPEHETRKLILTVLKSCERKEQQNNAPDLMAENGVAVAQRSDDDEDIVELAEKLKEINVGLSTVFSDCFKREKTEPLDRELFRQVSILKSATAAWAVQTWQTSRF